MSRIRPLGDTTTTFENKNKHVHTVAVHSACLRGTAEPSADLPIAKSASTPAIAGTKKNGAAVLTCCDIRVRWLFGVKVICIGSRRYGRCSHASTRSRTRAHTYKRNTIYARPLAPHLVSDVTERDSRHICHGERTDSSRSITLRKGALCSPCNGFNRSSSLARIVFFFQTPSSIYSLTSQKYHRFRISAVKIVVGDDCIKVPAFFVSHSMTLRIRNSRTTPLCVFLEDLRF